VNEADRIDGMRDTYGAMREEIAREIVGQQQVIEEMMIALFAGGHALLEGVPGLAKTLLISSLSRVMDLTFNRIQFTPDLMPSDITGSEILEEDPVSRRREFRFLKGPVFANVIFPGHSSFWRRRTPSSRRGLTLCLKRSSTASCSTS